LIPGLIAAAFFQAGLALSDLRGEPQPLEQHRGKIVVLNFWATWCAPCLEEMPLLAGIHRRYQSRGVVVIGASADDASTRARVPEFVQKLGLPFPILTGATTADMERLGLGSALPATAVIDREGRVAARIRGVVRKRDLERRLEALLRSPGLQPGRHEHEPEEQEHAHGGIGMEGASTVPS